MICITPGPVHRALAGAMALVVIGGAVLDVQVRAQHGMPPDDARAAAGSALRCAPLLAALRTPPQRANTSCILSPCAPRRIQLSQTCGAAALCRGGCVSGA